MKKILSKFVGYFIQGIITLVPLLAVVLTAKYFYDLLLAYSLFENEWLTLLLGLGVVLGIGILARSIILQPIFFLFEELLSRTPGLKFVYSSIKDLMEAFVGEKKRFNKPVVINLIDETGLQRFGFVTDESLAKLGSNFEGKVAVYIPMSYSVSGNLYIVEAHRLTPLLGVDAAELMKYVLSGGVTDLDDVLDANKSVSLKEKVKQHKQKSKEEE